MRKTTAAAFGYRRQRQPASRKKKAAEENVLFIEKQRSAWGYLYECLTA
jgi:hypothetical protein